MEYQLTEQDRKDINNSLSAMTLWTGEFIIITNGSNKKKIEEYLINKGLAIRESLSILRLAGQFGEYLFNRKSIEQYLSQKQARFDRYKAEEKEKEATKQVDTELKISTINKNAQDLKIGEHLLRTKWWPHWIAFISVATALATFITSSIWHNADKTQNTEQKQTIEAMQKQLQATKSEIYTHVDSLLKKEHNEDTTKKK